MQSQSRRVHGAEFKSQVLRECRQPGASVAAVALAHGLNVNLVRKWLVGRGLERAGLAPPQSPVEPASPPLQFIPVQVPLAQELRGGVQMPVAAPQPTAEPLIHVELRRDGTQLTVQWPASQAPACAAWLRELGAALQ